MKIGINTLFHVPGDVGGTETYLRKTLRAIAENYPDVSLILYTSLSNDGALRNDLHQFPQVKFRRLSFKASFRPARILAEQSLLPLKIRKDRIDVLWSPGYTAPIYCSCPQVVTIPDLQYKSHPEDMGGLERRTLDILVKTSCRRARSIITISEFSKLEVVRYGFAPPEKITAIPLGVDPSFAAKVGSDEIDSSVCRPTAAPCILCVAHTYPHKNVHLLVEAYASLQDSLPHDLVLVGTARRGENLVSRSLHLVKDQARVRRLHGLDFPTLRHLYQRAALFVLPSSYEGFGLPVLEAMMAGTLVVSTRKASIPEVGGEHILYCDPLDADHLGKAMAAALHLPDEQSRKMIASAGGRARKLTWANTAHETMRVLQECALSC